jgi:hypothetical protein
MSSNVSEGDEANQDWQDTRGIEIFQQAMLKKLQIEEEDFILQNLKERLENYINGCALINGGPGINTL